MSEFVRPFDLRHLPVGEQSIEATAEERNALAARFGLVAINELRARIRLQAEGEAVRVTGRLRAAIVQSCAVSGEDLPVRIDEPVALRFVPPGLTVEPDAEIELDADDLDEIEYDGQRIDVGEALAQSLVLAIDPYASGPDADRVRKEKGLLGEAAASPFAALAALRAGGKESD